MTQLEIDEYGTRRDVELDADQRDALLGSPSVIELFPETGSAATWRLRAGPYVGNIVGPGVALRIRPKFGIARLFVMLSAASDRIVWDDRPVGLSTSSTVEDVVAMSLVDSIHRRLATGLLRGYVPQEEEACLVRGRLELAETIRRRPATLLPLVQTPDLHDENIAENRVLLAAVTSLVPRVASTTVRGRLLECQRLFADVSAILPRSPLPKITRNRLNARWWDTIELAMLVLRCCGLDLPGGSVSTRSFVVNMNVVFERFVYRALADALRRHGRELRHGYAGLYLDRERAHPLVPDLSLWTGRRCDFVGDCKYKAAEGALAERSDLYQALAYATATGLPAVTLIYGEGGRPGREVELVDGRTTVRVRVLDLAAPADSLRARFGELAAEIASGLSRAGAPRPATVGA